MSNYYQNDEFLRKREQRQKKIRKKRAKILLVVFLIFLLIAGALLSVTVLFPIKNITASGSEIYTTSQILENCGVNVGDNLIIASKDKTLNNLRTRLPFIEKVEFKRTFPDTLKITVSDAKEYACYKVGNKYYSTSNDGWVLKEYTKKPPEIILIIKDGIKCELGKKVVFPNQNIEELYTEITDSLGKYALKVNYININDEMNIEAKIESRFIVNFGSTEDFEHKVKHLKTMLENIGQNDTGKINLSMWNRQNTQGTFIKTEIK